MRIQTRLFLGTAALVLALMGLQWWLYSRQLRSIEQELGNVATTVGREILTAENVFFGHDEGHSEGIVWVGETDDAGSLTDLDTVVEHGAKGEVHIVKIPIPQVVVGDEHDIDAEFTEDGISDGMVEGKIELLVRGAEGESEDQRYVQRIVRRLGPDGEVTEDVQRLKVDVEFGERRSDRILVVKDEIQDLHRIPIPTSPTVERVQGTMREGAAVGGLLLLVGLFASAVMSRRLVRPLRSLADGAEALGEGHLGVQVPVSATGEIGDLQNAFNTMSTRLALLEGEREEWRKREHLAQLGDLSRGLAHTLRNPLHTLGLAVEELADGKDDNRGLVTTSRTQIRRIDRWLRSFLALGAEESAQAEEVDIAEIVDGVALESVQEGAQIKVEGIDGEFRARVVAGAVRAALANLVENAIEVSPAGGTVVVGLERAHDAVIVRVKDDGPGLPEEVREKLFSPHVTTKVGGSGMGLFLAKQLIVGMHGGSLAIEDADGGGTVATVTLPSVAEGASEGDRE